MQLWNTKTRGEKFAKNIKNIGNRHLVDSIQGLQVQPRGKGF